MDPLGALSREITAQVLGLGESWLRAHWQHSPTHPACLAWPFGTRREYRCACGQALTTQVSITLQEIVVRSAEYSHS